MVVWSLDSLCLVGNLRIHPYTSCMSWSMAPICQSSYSIFLYILGCFAQIRIHGFSKFASSIILDEGS